MAVGGELIGAALFAVCRPLDAGGLSIIVLPAAVGYLVVGFSLVKREMQNQPFKKAFFRDGHGCLLAFRNDEGNRNRCQNYYRR